MQKAILEYLRNVPQSTTQELAGALLAEKVRQKRGSYFYNLDARWSLLRSLHSLERRGLVVQRGFLAGSIKLRDEIPDSWRTGFLVIGRRFTRSIPKRDAVWAIAPPNYNPAIAVKEARDRKDSGWLKKIGAGALQLLQQVRLGPGDDATLYEDEEITIEICNFTDHEQLLHEEERSLGHTYVVGVDCRLYNIGYFSASGSSAIGAMKRALEELEHKLDNCTPEQGS